MNIFTVRNIAQNIATWTTAIAPRGRRDWAAAMAAEINYIDDDFEALVFSIGCLETVMMEQNHMSKIGSAIAVALGCAIGAWAVAKFYLLFILNGAETTVWPVHLWMNVSASGICYAGAAVSLFRKRAIAFGAWLGLALVANTLNFLLTTSEFIFAGGTGAADLTWRLAIVSEEYFVWTAFLGGAMLMIVLSRSGPLFQPRKI